MVQMTREKWSMLMLPMKIMKGEIEWLIIGIWQGQGMVDGDIAIKDDK